MARAVSGTLSVGAFRLFGHAVRSGKSLNRGAMCQVCSYMFDRHMLAAMGCMEWGRETAAADQVADAAAVMHFCNEGVHIKA